MQTRQSEQIQPLELLPLPEAPLVSILVPNYNYARYIGEAIESALRQTYSNFEVIICDDGSKDNSCEIVETYVQKDSRVKLIRKPNGGVASALNAAYREAKGEIISILDADDIWVESKLEKILKIFKSDSKCGFAIHNVIQINAQSQPIKSHPLHKRLATGWMALDALKNGGFVDDIPPASALSLRRQVTDYIFPLNEEFVRNADSLVFRCAPFITNIGSTIEVLSLFRIHGANTTSTLIPTVDSMEKEQSTLARIHQEQKLFLEKMYGAEFAAKLTDWRCSIIVRHNLYLIARLKKAPKAESRKAHQLLVNHHLFSIGFNGYLPQKLLFAWGEWLPDSIFAFVFEQIYGAGHIKRFMRWIKSQKLSISSIS
ncbi:glycosyltransferase family 2 protein [Dulcicalothrix desertica]|nr:glycosyltransferase family 2 protein [Dulcicalothrix desertica]TWH55712.1 glycosyltransferase involved in cell wall biosynthesis [Dulcicalothrix desertica PCC 7102]